MIASTPQPAFIGQAQHDFEAPRLAPKVKGDNWKEKISALGNAIHPLQIFPVLLAMALTDKEPMVAAQQAEMFA